MITEKTDLGTRVSDIVSNSSSIFAKQTFPADGLVAMSRNTYCNSPLITEEVRPGICVFLGAGGNVTAVTGSERCAVIDTGYGPRVDEVRNAIETTLSQHPCWLINTHWHFDHTDGNSAFASDGATVLAHVNCRVRLSHDQYVPSLNWRIGVSPKSAWPEVTIEGTSYIDVGPETLQVLPQRPAHTDGDLAVFLPSSNVLVMGDLFTNGSYPVIDESSGGTLRGMIEALEGLLPLINPGTIVVPGHGPLADRKSIITFHGMLGAIEDRILSLIQARLPVSEIIAASPTSEFDSTWGQGYVTGARFARMILAGIDFSEHRHQRTDSTAVCNDGDSNLN